MARPNHNYIISNSQAGMTLIEILVVLGILVVVASFGLLMSMDTYRGNSLHSEKDMIISVLQKARSRALNNINGTKHGVYITTHEYVIFQGESYDSNSSLNQTFKPSGNIAVSSPNLPISVIFDQLSAAVPNNTDFEISDGAKSFSISINSEGRISWELN